MARTSLSAAQRAPHGAKHIPSIWTLSRKNAGYHGAIFIFAITESECPLTRYPTSVNRQIRFVPLWSKPKQEEGLETFTVKSIFGEHTDFCGEPVSIQQESGLARSIPRRRSWSHVIQVNRFANLGHGFVAPQPIKTSWWERFMQNGTGPEGTRAHRNPSARAFAA